MLNDLVTDLSCSWYGNPWRAAAVWPMLSKSPIITQHAWSDVSCQSPASYLSANPMLSVSMPQLLATFLLSPTTNSPKTTKSCLVASLTL